MASNQERAEGLMANTLADMTPDERQSCVGMWCDNLASTAKEPAPVVLACVQGRLCWVLHTDIHGERSGFPLDSVAPRFDLPRAWNPDGTPAAMIQEWAARLESGGASIARTRAEAEQAHALHREQYENYGTGSYDMLGPPPPAPAGIEHRFTTEWEAIDE